MIKSRIISIVVLALIAVLVLVFKWSPVTYHNDHHSRGIVSPMWCLSPDGNSLVYSYAYGDDSSVFLYKADVDGAEAARRVTRSNLGDEYFPCFSPNGKAIVYVQYDKDNWHLHLVDLNGSDDRSIMDGTLSGTGRICWPIFSADGKTIFFVLSKKFEGLSPLLKLGRSWHGQDIFSINANGTDLKQLTYQGFYYMSPLAISPDGTNLLFEGGSGTACCLNVLSLKDNQIMHPYSTHPYSDLKARLKFQNENNSLEYLGYMPDGKSIIFLNTPNRNAVSMTNDIYRMDLESQKISQLTDMNCWIQNMLLSPDKKTIFLLRAEHQPFVPPSFSTLKQPQLGVIEINHTGFEPRPDLLPKLTTK